MIEIQGLKLKVLLVISILCMGSCSTKQDTDSIATSLKEVCNCKEVVVSLSTQGLTLSKKASNKLGERHELLIKGYSGNSLDTTTKNMLKALQDNKVCEGVLISIEFIDQDRFIEIDNCSIVVPK